MTHFNVTVEGMEAEAFSQEISDTLLGAALRKGIGFPYECNSGGCGSCKYQIVSGEVENLWPDAPALTARDRRKGNLLACQSRAKTDLCIRVRVQADLRPMVVPRRMKARLVAVHDITHDIREFRFHTDERVAFQPGQYALLSIPGVTTRRAYSMSNIANPMQDGNWEFQIRHVPNGKATNVLFHRLNPGDEIEIDGPYGMAYLRRDVHRDIICIAGGSGLAPMVSITRGASDAGLLKQRKLHFFYGARTPRDICGETMLRELPEFGSRIYYHPIVSSPDDGTMAWNGETGFVHDLVCHSFPDTMPEYEFYFAGPPPMTNALQEMLMLNHHVPFQQIHFDRFF
ncbi:MAG: 2Fe-2S iron-sulfur cluster binding domain-containing protein [Nevskiaceae bacterium]|nr:MAG: 2Fe-2S iron-sulfur cluster binding domain-containing protein [Nevskiaceae bacterium]TBR71958.1 MAG: 2Fe-2S iron-sulfur cluster binding domain-containing protein [Nevskiaceae bacterium]